MLNFKVHKKFINEFVFINHFESSQIYEHFSQHGNTDQRGAISFADYYVVACCT